MKVTYARFDAADYLDSDEVIAEYLTAAAEDSNPEVFLLALGNVARAKGIAKVAKGAGLGREKSLQGAKRRRSPAIRDRQRRTARARRQAGDRHRTTSACAPEVPANTGCGTSSKGACRGSPR